MQSGEWVGVDKSGNKEDAIVVVPANRDGGWR